MNVDWNLYSVWVLSLGACILLSHHLSCVGIDKDSGAMKLQNEPKQEKGRKEKKEKRKKGLKSEKHHRDLEKVEPVHKKRKYGNRGELYEKKIRQIVAMEPLENSDLSEEHGLPSSIPVPCESWESSKSRKLNPGTAFAPTRSHGSLILRIKLPLQKHKSPVPGTSCEVPKILECRDSAPVSSNDLVLNEPCFSGRPTEEAPSREKEDVKIPHGHSGSRKSKRRSKSEEMRRQIRDLISDWKPAQLLQGLESDQGWLFEKQQYRDPRARDCGLDSRVEEDVRSEKGPVASSYQPRACFMPEFNTYQMPYVFPF